MVEQGSQIILPVIFPIQTLLQEYAAMSQQEAQETVDKMKVTSHAYFSGHRHLRKINWEVHYFQLLQLIPTTAGFFKISFKVYHFKIKLLTLFMDYFFFSVLISPQQ